MTEEQQQRQEEFAKWEGKVSTTLPAVAADQVWPLLADFCSFQRWHPSVEACRLDGGVAGEPGCVRFCTGKSVQSVDGEGVAWVRERLTAIDHAGRRLSYEITENTIGWGSYEATMEVIGGDGEEGGCRIEWSFRMEPVAGGTEEGVVAYLGSTLEGMAKTIQDFLLGCRAQD